MMMFSNVAYSADMTLDEIYDEQFRYDKGYDAYEQGDYKNALKEWLPLANNGHPKAQFELGRMYKDGVGGVLQIYEEAVKWFRKSAEQGYAPAQFNLGWIYENGYGEKKSNILAHMWYNISGSNGGESGQVWRGLIAKKMTIKHISLAQDKAKICLESKYEKCS